jgi:transmembrane protein 138
VWGGEWERGEWERVGHGPLSFRIAQPLTCPPCPPPLSLPPSPRSVQFAIQILNLLLLFLLFFGTYLFQVGLLGEVFREFRPALIAMTLYLGVFSAYAGTKLSLLVGPPGLGQEELWSKSQTFVALSVLQKIAALLYYVMVLQTTLRLGEAKWYQRAPWVARYSDLAAATAAAAKAGMGGGGGGLTRR